MKMSALTSGRVWAASFFLVCISGAAAVDVTPSAGVISRVGKAPEASPAKEMFEEQASDSDTSCLSSPVVACCLCWATCAGYGYAAPAHLRAWSRTAQRSLTKSLSGLADTWPDFFSPTYIDAPADFARDPVYKRGTGGCPFGFGSNASVPSGVSSSDVTNTITKHGGLPEEFHATISIKHSTMRSSRDNFEKMLTIGEDNYIDSKRVGEKKIDEKTTEHFGKC